MPRYEYESDKDRRECDERRFFEERCRCDEPEKPRKRRCDDDWKDEKCHPCHDWCKCPPPWWIWPREDKKNEGEDERKDEKRREDVELAAFGYVFSLTAAPVTVAPNTDVVFNNNGPLRNITHATNTAPVIIERSGAYEIYYGVNAVAGAGATISLAVNGTVEPSTTITIGATPSETSGKVILNLRRGDVLTLRNTSAVTTITLAAAPSVGAQLTLERIGEINRCDERPL